VGRAGERGTGDIAHAASSRDDVLQASVTPHALHPSITPRHKMRHAESPPQGADGRPLRPLVLLTQRNLLVLLPSAAGAAAGAHDAGVRLRLQLYRNTEELLLPTPLPRPLTDDSPSDDAAHTHTVLTPSPLAPIDQSSWCESAVYDGADVVVLAPSGLKALTSGRHLIDPVRLHAAAAAVAQCRVEALGGGGGGGGGTSATAGDDDGVIAAEECSAAVGLVRAAALRGWQPQVLLPQVGAQEVCGAGGGVLRAVLKASHAEAGADCSFTNNMHAHKAPAADKLAALLAASADSLAVQPDSLRAVLSMAGGGAAAAAAAAGAAARCRELHQALKQQHGWVWQELGPDGGGELPAGLMSVLHDRLHAPNTALPPEPLADAPMGPAGWFFG